MLPVRTLQEMIDYLRAVRAEAAANAALVDEMRAAWEALPHVARAVTNAERAKTLCAELETRIRKAALDAFAENSDNKRPAAGVGIRVTTQLVYDPALALTWAKTTGLAVSLDTKAFEKIARSTPLEFVDMKEVPIATIARDL